MGLSREGITRDELREELKPIIDRLEQLGKVEEDVRALKMDMHTLRGDMLTLKIGLDDVQSNVVTILSHVNGDRKE